MYHINLMMVLNEVLRSHPDTVSDVQITCRRHADARTLTALCSILSNKLKELNSTEAQKVVTKK